MLPCRINCDNFELLLNFVSLQGFALQMKLIFLLDSAFLKDFLTNVRLPHDAKQSECLPALAIDVQAIDTCDSTGCYDFPI